MSSWIFKTLPSAMFELFFFAGLLGAFLLAADRKQKFMCRDNKILLLSAFVYMFLWRVVGARGSSRYSNLLIPLFLLFSSIFLIRLTEVIPLRFRKLFAVAVFCAVLAVCTVKIVRQYDTYRIRLYQSIAGCIQQEPGRVSLACDDHDGGRLAWYAKIPEFVPIYRQGNSPEEYEEALFPLKNRDGVFYVVFQNKLSSQRVTAEELHLAPEAWRFCGEFIKDRHRKYILRIYRFQPEPHWRKVTGPVQKQETVLPILQDGFENAEETAKNAIPEINFPAGWGGNGVPKKDVMVRLEKTEPISGTGSLFVSASIFEFLTVRYFPADRDYTLGFLVRGQAKTSLLARVYVYPRKGRGHAVNLDKFFFEDCDLHECRIPFSFRNDPNAHTIRIAFIVYDGSITLDDLQLIPETPQTDQKRKDEKTLQESALKNNYRFGN